METQPHHGPFVNISSLPDIASDEVDFLDTSFFQSSGQSTSQKLPSPAEIIQRCPELRDSGRGVVKFEELGLLVKYGCSNYLRLEEAQTLRAIKQAFPANEVPVPELFG